MALLKVPQIGIRTFYRAIDIFNSAENIFKASKRKLIEAKIFKNQSIDFIINFKDSIVEKDLQWLNNEDCHIISFFDKLYPENLKQIYTPPPILYARGDIKLLQKPQIAIVGSRNPTTAGMENSYNFAYELASDLVITSGMAIGIDSQAHLGALAAGGKTIAVCGTGLDLIYPPSNKNLAKSIAENGLLLSEFCIGTKAKSTNFPRRNRIITAISQSLLVVEANIKSGSMLSANYAIEQNKDIFAIPGSIKNPLSSGPHSLIKDGAYLVVNTEDIREILAINYKKSNKIEKHDSQSNNVLLKYLNYDGLTIDQIIEKSNLDVSTINNLLLQLELDNIIEKTIYNTYILK